MKKNILFVCLGNSCRSVMAEGYFRYLIKSQADNFLVGSAGVGAIDGYPSSAETLKLLKSEGIDMSSHKSRRITAPMVRTADKIFVMEQSHRDFIVGNWPEASEKTHLLTEYMPSKFGKGAGIDIPDPIRMSDGFYSNVYQVIKECVDQISAELGVHK